MPTDKCTECHKSYPVKYFQLMAYEGGYIIPCPRCALQIRNDVHGFPPSAKFTGSVAADLYSKFIKEFPEEKK